MLLSIIIVNYKVKEYLRQCIESVFSNANNAMNEVIVVDNASDDGSAEMVKEVFPDVKLIENKENLGFAKANNQAYEISKGEYILLLNPDTFVKKNAIEKCLEFMRSHSDAGACGCRLLYPDGRVQISARTFPSVRENLLWIFGLDRIFMPNKRKKFYYGNTAREVDYLMGAFLLLRRSALEYDKIFDEDFFIYAEEKDLCFRLKKRGYKVYYIPDAEVVHHLGKSAQVDSIENFIELQRSELKYFAKHYGEKYAKLLALSWGLVLLSTWIASSILGLLKGKNSKRKRLFRSALGWYVKNAKEMLKHQ